MGYETDLTDENWEFIRSFVEKNTRQPRGPGRPTEVDLRQVVNAILYKIRTGCQWRLIPSDFPARGTIRYYFDIWTEDGTIKRIHTVTREQLRHKEGRNPQPSAAIIDTQTVKTTEAGGERGYDGNKKINGRKRHILVDTEGNLLAVVSHSAAMQDRDGAEHLFGLYHQQFPELQKVWADGSYTGDIREFIKDSYDITLEVVEKQPDQKGFVLLPRRWVVERTFAWLGRCRGLSKEYERYEKYSESMMYLASLQRMLKRLHPNPSNKKPYENKHLYVNSL